ncbi:MAG TPA: energy transducer TonB, partial [Myxococcaceae bacterium]|nr:energy transducer TonB [Myxococcaceae bacterium]
MLPWIESGVWIRRNAALALLGVSFSAPAQDGGTFAPETSAASEAPAALEPPELVNPSPATYPADLERVTGTVELELSLDTAGVVTQVKVAVPAHPQLDEAAVEAAWGLRFRPARSGGQPVPVRVPFSYAFKLPERPPAAPRALLSGRVLSKGTRFPVPGATIRVD